MSYSFNVDYNDPPHIMQEKIENAIKEIRREKYETLLKFINLLLLKKIDSLLKFKNIDLEYLFKNKKNVLNAYETYKEFFMINFKIILSDSDLTLKTFITNFSKCLKAMGYKLTKSQYESKTLHSIVLAN